MTLKHMSLLAGGIALALAGGAAQAVDAEPTFADQPTLEDKPADKPGRGGGNNRGGGNDNRGPGNNNGNRGGDGTFGATFTPPGQLPDLRGPAFGDDGDDHPGRGLGRSLAPGQCEADDGDLNIPGPAGQAGASHTAHVNFVGVDEEGLILDGEDAPWGRMTYFWIAPTFDFVFNGHNLIVGNDDEGTEGNIVYTLAAEIEGEDDTVSLLCLGSAAVNDGGNVHILGSLELDSHLPPDLDPEGDDEEDSEGGDDAAGDDEAPGVGLVLLPEDAVDCDTGETFDGAEGDVLFSVEDVLYVDTDLLEDDEEDDEGDG